MTAALRAARSAVSFLLVLSWMLVPAAPLVYFFVLPLGLAWARERRAIASWYVRFVCRGIFFLFELGGARFVRRGTIPTREPCLILMNHQSLLDIPTVALMAGPYVPAFVPRVRYTRWYILDVAPGIHLLECPIVDPRRDAKGAAQVMGEAALRHRHGLLVFPEGHRTLDGELRPFKPAGTQAILEARRLPVYLVVTDGFWAARRLVDFALNVHSLRGATEVMGPFEPPTDTAGIPAFIEWARSAMVTRLHEMRDRRHAAA